MDRLKDKVVIVTGGTSGIGEASVKLFAAEGGIVICVGRNEERGNAVVKYCTDNGGKCEFYKCDVTKKEEDYAMIDYVYEKYGRVDCYLANAGYAGTPSPKYEDQLSFENMYKCVETNVFGVWYQMEHLLPKMAEAGKGTVVSINSTVPIRPSNLPGYATSKGAIKAMFMDLAAMYAPKGIRINKIHPGVIDTPMSAGTTQDPVIGPAFAKTIPYLKITPPEAVAQAALFLLSDESDHIVGTSLDVCGGFNMGKVVGNDVS